MKASDSDKVSDCGDGVDVLGKMEDSSASTVSIASTKTRYSHRTFTTTSGKQTMLHSLHNAAQEPNKHKRRNFDSRYFYWVV